MESDKSSFWKDVMDDEYRSLIKNNTWQLAPKPKDGRVIKCKWIYKKKPRIRGTEWPWFKAQLVAKGFTQVEGIDYNEIFSSIVKHTTIRVLLVIVV